MMTMTLVTVFALLMALIIVSKGLRHSQMTRRGKSEKEIAPSMLPLKVHTNTKFEHEDVGEHGRIQRGGGTGRR